MSAAVILPEVLPRLRPREPLARGLRRVLLGCLDRAEQVAADDSLAETERVHDARLALKRARAVMHLAENGGLAWAGAARPRIATLARELGAVRDPTVVTGAAQRLGCAVVIGGLATPTSWPAWSRRLSAERRRLVRRSWTPLTWKTCRAALAESVRRLDRREQRAGRGFKAGRLHAWRKAVIELREQLNVLQARLDPRQRGHAAHLNRVARKLGLAQDLAMLITATKLRLPKVARAGLVGLAQRKRRQAVRRARSLATGLTEKLRAGL